MYSQMQFFDKKYIPFGENLKMEILKSYLFNINYANIVILRIFNTLDLEKSRWPIFNDCG